MRTPQQEVIKLSGPAHSVFVQWDLILHKYGNISLGEYDKLQRTEAVLNTHLKGRIEPCDFGRN